MTQTICPNCKRTLRNANAWHYCKEVEIDDLFLDKSDEIVLAFDSIMQQVSEWEGVSVSGTKNCVVFVRNKTFLVIKPMKKWLEVKFYSEKVIDEDALHKCHAWNSKFECIFRFENEHQIAYSFFHYFKKSYEIS